MPGRKRMKARKVAALEENASELFSAFHQLMPELYRERLQLNDPLAEHPVCAAWGEAWAGLTAAHKGLVALRQLLDEQVKLLPLHQAIDA